MLLHLIAHIIQILTYPAVWVLLLLAAGLAFRRKRKKLLGIAFVTLLLFSNPFLADEALRAWEPEAKAVNQLAGRYDVILVTGGITVSNSNLPDRSFTQRGADRLLHAYWLWRQGLADFILLSGGSPDTDARYGSEAGHMRQILLSAGMPAEAILMEPEAGNTYENVLFSESIIRERFGDDARVLLITSGYHMPRASACMEATGLRYDTFPTDFLAHERVWRLSAFIPQSQAMNKWHHLIKEMVGILSYRLLGRI